jgi:SAM-dependent methyltransferase
MNQKQLDRLPGLVELRNQIKHMAQWEPMFTAQEKLHLGLCELLGTFDEVSNLIAPTVESIASIKQTVADTQTTVDQVLHTLEHEIEQIAQAVSGADYCKEKLLIDSNTRKKFLNTQKLLNELVVRTGLPDIWKFPTCIINAENSQLIEQVMAGDVVYIVDVDAELVQKQIEPYTPAVKSRVRVQQIDNWHDLDFSQYISTTLHRNRWGLPTEQMAIVLISGIFERYNLGAIDLALNPLKKLLRPGGKLLFTVNNADSPGGAGNVVVGANGYVVKSKLQDIVEKHGLVFKSWSYVTNQDFALVEVWAPGPLQSSKYQPGRTANKKA